MHDIYHIILKNRKIDHLIMPLEALYCLAYYYVDFEF